MSATEQIYTAEENKKASSGLGLITGMNMEGAITFKNFRTTFSTHKFLKGFYNANAGDIYVKSYFTVRGAYNQVAARVANYYHKSKNPAFKRSEHINLDEESYLEVPNDHSMIAVQHFSFPPPLADREGICNMVWKRTGDKSIVVTVHPLMSHPKVENKDGKAVIRATFQNTFLITQLDDGTSEIEYGVHINFGGYLPRTIVNGFIIPNFNRILSHYQAYFTNPLELEDLTAKDGKLLGEILINQIKTARKSGGWKKRADLGKVGVDEFLYCSVAMRRLLVRFPWLRILLHEISLNQVNGARIVKVALLDMTEADAINLAKAFSASIFTSTEPASAVDQWIAQNVALEEFEKEFSWMRPFFVELAKYTLNASNLGLRLRVFAGALLSTTDLITDIYMTITFFNTEGQEGYGSINAWLIGLTLICQINLSYILNKKSTSHFFKDTLYILTGVKPAVDAYRVVSGAEKEDH